MNEMDGSVGDVNRWLVYASTLQVVRIVSNVGHGHKGIYILQQ